MVGYALRWGCPAYVTVDGRPVTETFRRGAFARSIAEGRVRMCLDHDWSAVVARQADGTLHLVEDAVGLRVDATANHSAAGDDAVDAVRCRFRAGLSVSFEHPVVEWHEVDCIPVREIIACDLYEVSVCRSPAYRSSEIVAGRMRIERFLEQAQALGNPHLARLARLEAAEAALRQEGVGRIPLATRLWDRRGPTTHIKPIQMLRVSHLSADLSAFLRHAQRHPFVLGQFDCSLLLADWWQANHGADPAAEWRGTYSTQDECTALLRQHGGLPRLIARMARRVGAVRTNDPQPGDFAVLRAPTAWAAAIRTPTGRWAVKDGEGLTAVRDVRVVAAWKI